MIRWLPSENDVRKSVDKNGDEKLEENTRRNIHSKSSNTTVETMTTLQKEYCVPYKLIEKRTTRRNMRIGNDPIYHGNNDRI